MLAGHDRAGMTTPSAIRSVAERSTLRLAGGLLLGGFLLSSPVRSSEPVRASSERGAFELAVEGLVDGSCCSLGAALSSGCGVQRGADHPGAAAVDGHL